MKNFFIKWNVSLFVQLSQGDNELFLDISNNSYLDILLDEIHKNPKTVVLKEWLYDFENEDVNQFIMPLKKNLPLMYKYLSPIHHESNVRKSHPGGKWIYFKIYCDANYADLILKKIFSQIIRNLEKTYRLEKWFFIRFLDPHHHIRLRLQIKSADFSGELINIIHQKLNSFIKKNIIWKINLDTYNREAERYSPSKIDSAEYAFYKDSFVFARLLLNKDFEENIRLRIFSAAKNIDSWLNLFRLDLDAKKNFCEKMKKTFTGEQSETFKVETEKKYRENQDLFYSFLKSDKFEQLFKFRNKDLETVDLSIHNLQDFIHMSINRWFITNQRNWEFMVYYFCFKYYSRCLYNSSERHL